MDTAIEVLKAELKTLRNTYDDNVYGETEAEVMLQAAQESVAFYKAWFSTADEKIQSLEDGIQALESVRDQRETEAEEPTPLEDWERELLGDRPIQVGDVVEVFDNGQGNGSAYATGTIFTVTEVYGDRTGYHYVMGDPLNYGVMVKYLRLVRPADGSK